MLKTGPPMVEMFIICLPEKSKKWHIWSVREVRGARRLAKGERRKVMVIR